MSEDDEQLANDRKTARWINYHLSKIQHGKPAERLDSFCQLTGLTRESALLELKAILKGNN